ncbi:MAG: sensor histidine kinase [Pseudonocardiaceae bacterium]
MGTDVRMDTETRPHLPVGTPRGPRRELLIFIGCAVLTLAIISGGTVLIVNQVARTVATSSAQDTATGLANLVGPLLGDALGGDQARRDELDRAVKGRLGGNSLIGIFVWRADGEIVYAGEADQIGQRLPPPKEVTDVIKTGLPSSAINDTARVPTPPEGPSQRTIDVYVPLQLAGQPPFVFAAHFSYRWVEQATTLLLVQILPLCLGGLVLLQLVQVPIAVRLSRRVARQQAERAELLERALSASERERRQLAADLHDGLIQDLAGAGYALAALAKSVPSAQAATADRVGVVVRGAVDSLRHLMVDLYPPDLAGAGLSTALDDLVRPLRKQGVAVSVEVVGLPPVAPEAATTLYRVAKEALTNIAKHAQASAVQISLEIEPGPDRDEVVLRVIDNGVGLPTDALEHRAEGHLGLQLLIDRISDLGGELVIHRADGRGTIVEARVPASLDGERDHPGYGSEQLDNSDVIAPNQS